MGYILLAVFVICLIWAIFATPGDDSSSEVRYRLVEIDGITFEFRFWTEYLGSAELPYAGIYKVLPPKTRFGKTIPQYECVDRGWGATDRVQWCYDRAESYIAARRQSIADNKAIEKFLAEAVQ